MAIYLSSMPQDGNTIIKAGGSTRMAFRLSDALPGFDPGHLMHLPAGCTLSNAHSSDGGLNWNATLHLDLALELQAGGPDQRRADAQRDGARNGSAHGLGSANGSGSGTGGGATIHFMARSNMPPAPRTQTLHGRPAAPALPALSGAGLGLQPAGAEAPTLRIDGNSANAVTAVTVGAGARNVTLTLLFDQRGAAPGPVQIRMGGVALPEDLHALEAGTFYLTDQGAPDLARLYAMHRAGAYFIACPATDLSVRRVYSAAVDKHAGVVCDQTVALNDAQAAHAYPEQLRRVRFRDRATGQTSIFLSNDQTLPAPLIARLHRNREQFESFYAWLRQQLRIGSAVTALLLLSVLPRIFQIPNMPLMLRRAGTQGGLLLAHVGTALGSLDLSALPAALALPDFSPVLLVALA